MDKAQAAYRTHKLLGSSEKDLVNVQRGKAAGAEINAEPKVLDRELALVSAPACKRLALSDLTLRIASLPATTDALHSCLLGAWTSAGLFRRPVLSCLDSAYRLVPGSMVEPQNPRTIPLPRDVAQELTLMALLGPIAVSDIAVPFLPVLYATDSSQRKRAIVSAEISTSLAQGLWLSSDRKGAYAKLATKTEAILKRIDPMAEDLADNSMADLFPENVARPLAYHFDFIEVFSGASVITKEMARLGWRVGPPLDLDFSEAYDLGQPLAISDGFSFSSRITALLAFFFLLRAPPFPLPQTRLIDPVSCLLDLILRSRGRNSEISSPTGVWLS